MPGAQRANSGNPLWLEDGERRLERLKAFQVGSVGTGRRCKLRIAFNQESDSGILHDRCQRLHVGQEGHFFALSKWDEHSRNRRGIYRLRKNLRETGRNLRGDQVQPRGRALPVSRCASGRHGPMNCLPIRAEMRGFCNPSSLTRG